MAMRFYYPMRNGFFIPGLASQPVEGTVLPYLRPLSGGVPQGDPVTGTPLTITYRPAWPDAVPELRIGETLTLPKFGLPQVRGQSSARVLYEQSVAIKGSGNPSVVLHDSTRAKSVALAAIPTSIATTGYQGRTYFQRLAPHLQQRVYATSGSNPQLIFLGEFVDEIAGEDYLHLNVLSAEDVAALKGLAEVTDVDKAAWDDTIDALSTTVETFIENPAQKGSYIVGGSVVVDGTSLAEIHASDAAVDSYAMTSTGAAAGYVSLLFADGEAFTPQGDPVTISVIKVVPELYKGDMKVDFPGNPLDEQVSLRHSGDFAARPDDYEFDWRYAPGGEIPPVYEYGAPQAVLNNGTTWTLVRNPGTAWKTTTSVGVPRTLMIYDANHPGGDSPGVLMQSQTPVDFSAGLPGDIIFSADLSNSLDGLVLYINGIVALGFRAPEPFENTAPSSGLSAGGLPGQFRLSTNYFSKGLNTISVALYSTADPLFTSSVNFRLEAVTKEDRVDPDAYPSSPWLKPGGTLLNQITIGGSPTAPLGDPLLVMQDNSFTLRYRPKLGSGGVLTEGAAVQDDIEWSEWLDPKLVPGWVKRVLDAINPYNQRMTDLFNNAVNTDVSVITQAGTRWEGDIALNLDNVNDAGLIEIYETILNRAKLFSIDNGYDLPGTNDALLLAAGYLNDLYVVLGNEAYADAANPTISLDDQQTVTEVSSSRFSFEGQVATVMEEELALLRGRDDFLSTSVNIAPAYNRLYWNYTNGIDSGEVLYAVNYNIKEKAGSSTANGIIDAADAQRMFPQSHGDAYGHYLTALTGYYKLLTNPHFTWIPRSETVLVLGQNVAVDYFDERKFAGAAADLARSAEQILGLTCRQTYQDDKSAGWGHFRDNQVNSQTGVRRQWGVDEWTSRATQGAYFHWVNGNAMLPDVDTDPTHTGIRKVDRGTVPELGLLAASGDSFQTLIDRANAFLNPLGLSPDAIAFDISPAELKAGNSHFEQIHQRALTAVLNAKGSFDQAGRMTRLLRNQENQIDEFNTAIEDGERAFNYKLIDLYGSPYPGDVGPGKTYGQGYDGPDLANWFVVDRPSGLVDTSGPLSIEARVLVNLPDFTGLDLMEINDSATGGTDIAVRTIHLSPSPFAQFSEDWFPGTDTGQRRVTGQLQQALTNAQLAYIAVQAANASLENEYLAFDRKLMLMRELIRYHQNISSERSDSMEKQRVLSSAALSLEVTAGLAKMAYESTKETSDATADAFPKMAGFSNDFSGFLRWSVKAVSFVIGKTFKIAALNADKAAKGMEALKKVEEIRLANMLAQLGFSYEEQQAAYELEMQFEEMTDGYYEIARLSLQLQKATEEVRTLIACGDRLQLEREIFRKRAATLVQGYRTRDVAFRTFRNEALEQYRTLFDLAGRYTYLAAKSYDYETGLLGTAQGRGIFNRIVASRALGDLSGGVPQATTSTLGDAGLAGTMAQLAADFSVAEGRLGINNPDSNGTLFSLRHELFRILNDPDSTEDDEAWQQTLEQHIVSDLMADPDAATHCRNLRKPDGSRVPGIIIPFTSTIRHGYNWFGLPLAGGDHNFSPSNFATKIYAAGMVMDGYVGMDPYAIGTPGAGSPASGDADALAATPYVYLIPTGTDYMLAPAFGDTGVVRAWNVADQALPLPYNLGATDFNDTGLFDANGTLSEQPWILRKHQAFRPVNDPAFFYSLIPQEFSSSRLVGRSVWNGGWKIVIPAYSLLDDEQEGLNRFVRSVDDIRIFLRTYSNSGN
jgi:hypothetical protein